MVRKILVLGLLAMSLAAPSAHAQTAPAGAAAPAASAVDPGVDSGPQGHGGASADTEALPGVDRTDRRARSGRRPEAAAYGDGRHGRRSVRTRCAHGCRAPAPNARLVYDGKTVTLCTPAQKYYSTVEFAGTIGELIDRLEERYGVEVPLSDLFLWGTPAAPLDKIESAMNAGQDFIDKDLCDHYAFRQGKIDWQIWITTGSKPLPRKVVITNRADEARPQSVSLIDWNLKPTFKDSVFKFTPPKGATKIEIVPRKTK